DGTPVTQLPGPPPQLLPSPHVCVELGYALQCKRQEQVLLVQQERDDLPGQFPFEVPAAQRILFKREPDLQAQLAVLLVNHLQRFSLF
ncbi:MAG: hypothetical protein O2890_12560, partial [Cyanobacteria bacterium]|nr:hypothetical protein [Cyanobacteriota bacterium]